MKTSLSILAAGILLAFGIFLSGPAATAGDWDDNDGNTLLCKDSASRSVRQGGASDDISVWEKVKTGKDHPLLLVFNSDVDNSLSFDGGKAKVDIFQNPRPACKLKKIIVNTDASCNLADTNAIQVKFTCTDGGQDLYNLDNSTDSEALTPPNQIENLFNAANTVLGMGLTFAPECGTLANEAEQVACAASVCNGIKDQLTNGNTKAIRTAGDLGSLYGSMQSSLANCATKSSIFSFQGPVACSPDDVAATVALDLLLAAPQESVQVDSDGAGEYLLSILAGSTIFTPGDFFQINMNTCVADFNVQ